MIGTFGCLCMAQALFCAYLIEHLSLADLTQYLTSNTIDKMKNTQELLLISFLVFSLAGIFSIVSAIGIFLNKVWGKNIWLVTTLFIFAYVILAFYKNPYEWSQYLAVIFLNIYSWIVLWYLPRKNYKTIL